MQAVILTAIADACGQPTDSCSAAATEANHRRALSWITDAGSDFRSVCELAGLDPETVRKHALAFIESGQAFPRTRRDNRQARRRNPRSIAAIAARAGVSATATGNVLRHNKGSPELKDRVRAAIREIEAQQELAA